MDTFTIVFYALGGIVAALVALAAAYAKFKVNEIRDLGDGRFEAELEKQR